MARSREITSHIWIGSSRISRYLLFYTVNKILDLFIHTAEDVVVGLQVDRNLTIRFLSNMTNNGHLEYDSCFMMFYGFFQKKMCKNSTHNGL